MKKYISAIMITLLMTVAMAAVVFAAAQTSYSHGPVTVGPLQYWESVRMEFGTATTHQGKITYEQVSAAGDSRISIFKNVLVLPVEEAYRNIPGNANKKNIPDIFVTVSSKGLTYNLPFGSISAGKNHAYRVRNYDSANYTVTSFKDTW